MHRLFQRMVTTATLVAALLALSGGARAFQTSPAKGKGAEKAAQKAEKVADKAASKTTAAAGPADKAIADAKAKGLVWVNTESKVYHKEGHYYGKTKQGQFMTEADAQKAGYRAAGTPGGAKKTGDEKKKK